jgi:hypothetical protein
MGMPPYVRPTDPFRVTGDGVVQVLGQLHTASRCFLRPPQGMEVAPAFAQTNPLSILAEPITDQSDHRPCESGWTSSALHDVGRQNEGVRDDLCDAIQCKALALVYLDRPEDQVLYEGDLINLFGEPEQ